MLLAWLGACLGSLPAQTEPDIPRLLAGEATNSLGKTVIVYGKLAGVQSSEAWTSLYFGNDYPEQLFTARIPEPLPAGFTNLDAVIGHRIEVRGVVKYGAGRRFMVLTNADQLKIGERAKPPTILDEEVAVHIIALGEVLAKDPQIKASNAVYYVKCHACDAEEHAAITRALAGYPLKLWTRQTNAPMGDINTVPATNKTIVWCAVKVLSRNDSEVRLQIDCRVAETIGIGYEVILEKTDGAWKVQSCMPNWIA